MKNPKNVKRGRRARQRGAELQRQAVRMAKDAGLEAYNRDRGGAQHEQGDIEIEGHYYGCKRRTRIAQWLKPEKEEEGVVVCRSIIFKPNLGLRMLVALLEEAEATEKMF